MGHSPPPALLAFPNSALFYQPTPRLLYFLQSISFSLFPSVYFLQYLFPSVFPSVVRAFFPSLTDAPRPPHPQTFCGAAVDGESALLVSPARHQLFTWALDALAPLADLPRGRPAAEAAELLLRLWERSCAELPPRALLLGAAKKPSASRSYGYRAASAWPVPKPGCADVERLGWAWSELRRRVGLDLSAGREFGGCWSVAQLARVLAATQALAARARPSPALLGLDLAAPCPLGMWGAGPGGAADRILEVVAAWSAFAVGVWAKLRRRAELADVPPRF